MVLLRISLAGNVPQGSAKVPRGSVKVPQGSAMAFLKISLVGKVPQGCAKVPQGSRRFREEKREGESGDWHVFFKSQHSAKVREGKRKDVNMHVKSSQSAKVTGRFCEEKVEGDSKSITRVSLPFLE